MRRALVRLKSVLRRMPKAAPIRCSICGAAADEGIGVPDVDRVCLACAVMLQVRCTEGDMAACERLEALIALGRRARPQGASETG